MKVLMVGLGGIGQRHARNLRTMRGAGIELIAYRQRGLSAVVTPQLSLDRSKTIEDEFGIRRFDSLPLALAEKPEIAFICNPSSLHVDVALQCSEAGCDLFIEKPLANSLKNVDRLADLVDAKKQIVMIGFQLRFHPCVRRLSDVLNQGLIGRPLAVRATIGEFMPYWHRYEDYRQMYAARADLGGGVILSQIHELDYLISLFGTPKRVFALGGHWSSLEIDVEDTASIMLECETGGRTLPIHLQLDYLQYPPARNCEVVGEEGKVSIDFVANEIMLFVDRKAEGKREKVENFERNQLFLDELAHFLTCVATRQRPVVDLHDGISSLRVALAAKESIATGQVVEMEKTGGKLGVIAAH
jgi:predicted dehydrogenase